MITDNNKDILLKFITPLIDNRKKLDVSMSTIASELGCSRQTIWSFEHGNNNNAIILIYYLDNFNK